MASALVGIRVGWGLATMIYSYCYLFRSGRGPQDLYFNKHSATAIQNSRKAGLEKSRENRMHFYISSKVNAYVYVRHLVCKISGFFPLISVNIQ